MGKKVILKISPEMLILIISYRIVDDFSGNFKFFTMNILNFYNLKNIFKGFILRIQGWLNVRKFTNVSHDIIVCNITTTGFYDQFDTVTNGMEMTEEFLQFFVE